MENYQDTMAGRSPSTNRRSLHRNDRGIHGFYSFVRFSRCGSSGDGGSLLFQVAGQGKWGNFIAQWVPTWKIIGLYNKIVKLEGHDNSIAAILTRSVVSRDEGARSRYGAVPFVCSNCGSDGACGWFRRFGFRALSSGSVGRVDPTARYLRPDFLSQWE